ncbi:MAG: hypothetical protein WC919_06885 [Candidatus Paceibacterota bacterium]
MTKRSTDKPVRQNWFAGMSREQIDAAIAAKKALLLQMIRSGQPRPRRYQGDKEERHLARSMEGYITKSSSSYDFSFDVAMRAVPSDWFDADRYDRGKQAMKDALERAHSGGPRPQPRTGDLRETAMNSQVNWHREIFEAIRPDWFDPDMEERVAKIKVEVLLLAQSGAKRPVRRYADSPELERLAEAIDRFTAPSQHAYDAEFTDKLRAIRPDWFRDTKLEIMRQRDEDAKKMFLAMATSGANRPPIKGQRKLARLLSRLINTDKEFHRQITEANPKWVGKKRDMKKVWESRPVRQDKEYTYEGETLSLSGWATKLGCKENTLYQYLLNHSIEQAVKLHTRKMLTCDDESHTLTEWAKKLGISASSLCGRLNSYPPEVALSPKNWENRR